MRNGTAIFLIAAGAVLLFALRAGSPHWLNLPIVGVILILTGMLGLMLPRVMRVPHDRDGLRRWVRPGRARDPRGAPAADPGGHNNNRPALAGQQGQRQPR